MNAQAQREQVTRKLKALRDGAEAEGGEIMLADCWMVEPARGPQGGAGAAESHIRRNVVERNLSDVGDTTDGKDLAVLDDNAQRIA